MQGRLPGTPCEPPVWKELWALSLRQGREGRSHRKHTCLLHHGRGTRERGSSPFGAVKSQHKPRFEEWRCHSQSQDESRASLAAAGTHLLLILRGRNAHSLRHLLSHQEHSDGPVLPGNNSQASPLLCEPSSLGFFKLIF